MTLTKALAESVIGTNYLALSPEVVDKTKRHILDTLGVMLAPTTLERACISLYEIARELGGTPESTFIGFGGKGPSCMAAFVNGALCHPIDYDDTIDETGTHPSGHTVPAALAVAEKRGMVSGKDFITACALGMDINFRLSAAPNGSLFDDYPWFSVNTFGIFSATAAAGKVIGLNVDELINAFGIALDRASGITKSIMSPESEIRAIGNGYANREAVLAVLMAKRGIVACKDSIEKLYNVYYDDHYDRASVVADVGRDIRVRHVAIKPWPACRVAHTYIKAGMTLLNRPGIAPEGIERIIVTVAPFAASALCEPASEKRRPKRSINAKVSLPFIMGTVFAKRRITIADFMEENLLNPEVLALADKVSYRVDSQLSEGNIGPGIVEVRTKDGEHFSQREDVPYGHPDNPMNDTELIAKFWECARYAAKPLPPRKVDELIKSVLELEKVKDLDDITRILA